MMPLENVRLKYELREPTPFFPNSVKNQEGSSSRSSLFRLQEEIRCFTEYSGKQDGRCRQ